MSQESSSGLHSSQSHQSWVMAQKASLYMATFAQIWLPLLHRYEINHIWSREKGCSEKSICTQFRYSMASSMAWQNSNSSGSCRSEQQADQEPDANRNTNTNGVTERRRCTAGRRPRAPGDQPDGRRHGRRAYPAAGQEHGTGARPLPTRARVAVSALRVRPHGACCDCECMCTLL
jgi:hypothetical protein